MTVWPDEEAATILPIVGGLDDLAAKPIDKFTELQSGQHRMEGQGERSAYE